MARLTTSKSFKVLEREAGVPDLFGYDRRGFVAQTVFRYYGLIEEDRAYWRQQPVAAAEEFVNGLLGDEELSELRTRLAEVEGVKKSLDEESALDNLVFALKNIPPAKTSSMTRQQVRVYAETLRQLMLKIYGGCCALCETREESQLRVSHLAPWAKQPEWRLDPQNVILVCRAHDGLIDTGLITLAADFSIVVSPVLDLNQNAALAQLIQTASFRAPAKYGPAEQCLAYHREYVLKAPAKKVAAATIKASGPTKDKVKKKAKAASKK